MTNKRSARRWGASALAMAVVLAAAACGGGGSSSSEGNGAPAPTSTVPAPTPGGKIVYGIEADPNGLDPTRNAWDPSGLLVANAIFDTLTAFDANSVAQPYLAKSLDHNADFTDWTIRLRDGVTFHDGTPLNADAGVKMLKAIQASAITGPPAQYIETVTKVDEMSYVAHMKQPWASFPAILTGQGGYVIAPKQLDDPEGSSHPIGTGPFRIKEWEVGKRVSVAKNTSYWRTGLPYLDNVDFKVIEDGSERVTQLQNGSVDVIHASNISETSQLDALPKDGRIVVNHDPGATESTFVMLNTAKAPLDDVRVRQAIAYATDLQALADQNGWPKERLTDSPFAPDSPWYAKVDFPRANLAKAKELIASYEKDKGPVSFELAGPFEISLLQQLSDQWAQAGIKTTVSVVEFKKNVILAVGGNFDALLFRYFAAPDPDVVWHFWSSKTVAPLGSISLNFAHLADEQIDEGLTAGRASADPAVRKAAYAKVQKRFADLVPYVWLYRTDWVIATSAKVHDARNVTLPDGSPSMPYAAGVHRLAETWISSAG